jgi:hypothetical protein
MNASARVPWKCATELSLRAPTRAADGVGGTRLLKEGRRARAVPRLGALICAEYGTPRQNVLPGHLGGEGDPTRAPSTKRGEDAEDHVARANPART